MRKNQRKNCNLESHFDTCKIWETVPGNIDVSFEKQDDEINNDEPAMQQIESNHQNINHQAFII